MNNISLNPLISLQNASNTPNNHLKDEVRDTKLPFFSRSKTSDRYLAYMMSKGYLNLEGTISIDFQNKSIPPLDNPQFEIITKTLLTAVEINKPTTNRPLNSNMAITCPIDTFLKDVNQRFTNTEKRKPHCQIRDMLLVGGIVPYCLQNDFLKRWLTLFLDNTSLADELLNKDFLLQIEQFPSDIDTRILIEKLSVPLENLRDEIYTILSTKVTKSMSNEEYANILKNLSHKYANVDAQTGSLVREIIKAAYLLKTFIPRDSKDQFAIISFGERSGVVLELLLQLSLERTCLFRRDSLRLSIKDFLETGHYSKLKLESDYSINQIFSDWNGQIIHVPNFSLADEDDWTALLSRMISKGERCLVPDTEKKLYEVLLKKALEKNKGPLAFIIERLKKRLLNHHGDDPTWIIALAIQACTSIRTAGGSLNDIKTIWKGLTTSIKESFLHKENNSSLIHQITNALENDKISFDDVSDCLELGAFIVLNKTKESIDSPVMLTNHEGPAVQIKISVKGEKIYLWHRFNPKPALNYLKNQSTLPKELQEILKTFYEWSNQNPTLSSPLQTDLDSLPVDINIYENQIAQLLSHTDASLSTLGVHLFVAFCGLVKSSNISLIKRLPTLLPAIDSVSDRLSLCNTISFRYPALTSLFNQLSDSLNQLKPNPKSFLEQWIVAAASTTDPTVWLVAKDLACDQLDKNTIKQLFKKLLPSSASFSIVLLREMSKRSLLSPEEQLRILGGICLQYPKCMAPFNRDQDLYSLIKLMISILQESQLKLSLDNQPMDLITNGLIWLLETTTEIVPTKEHLSAVLCLYKKNVLAITNSPLNIIITNGLQRVIESKDFETLFKLAYEMNVDLTSMIENAYLEPENKALLMVIVLDKKLNSRNLLESKNTLINLLKYKVNVVDQAQLLHLTIEFFNLWLKSPDDIQRILLKDVDVIIKLDMFKTLLMNFPNQLIPKLVDIYPVLQKNDLNTYQHLFFDVCFLILHIISNSQLLSSDTLKITSTFLSSVIPIVHRFSADPYYKFKSQLQIVLLPLFTLFKKYSLTAESDFLLSDLIRNNYSIETITYEDLLWTIIEALKASSGNSKVLNESNFNIKMILNNPNFTSASIPTLFELGSQFILQNKLEEAIEISDFLLREPEVQSPTPLFTELVNRLNSRGHYQKCAELILKLYELKLIDSKTPLLVENVIREYLKSSSPPSSKESKMHTCLQLIDNFAMTSQDFMTEIFKHINDINDEKSLVILEKILVAELHGSTIFLDNSISRLKAWGSLLKQAEKLNFFRLVKNLNLDLFERLLCLEEDLELSKQLYKTISHLYVQFFKSEKNHILRIELIQTCVQYHIKFGEKLRKLNDDFKITLDLLILDLNLADCLFSANDLNSFKQGLQFYILLIVELESNPKLNNKIVSYSKDLIVPFIRMLDTYAKFKEKLADQDYVSAFLTISKRLRKYHFEKNECLNLLTKLTALNTKKSLLESVVWLQRYLDPVFLQKKLGFNEIDKVTKVDITKMSAHEKQILSKAIVAHLNSFLSFLHTQDIILDQELSYLNAFILFSSKNLPKIILFNDDAKLWSTWAKEFLENFKILQSPSFQIPIIQLFPIHSILYFSENLNANLLRYVTNFAEVFLSMQKKIDEKVYEDSFTIFLNNLTIIETKNKIPGYENFSLTALDIILDIVRLTPPTLGSKKLFQMSLTIIKMNLKKFKSGKAKKELWEIIDRILNIMYQKNIPIVASSIETLLLSIEGDLEKKFELLLHFSPSNMNLISINPTVKSEIIQNTLSQLLTNPPSASQINSIYLILENAIQFQFFKSHIESFGNKLEKKVIFEKLKDLLVFAQNWGFTKFNNSLPILLLKDIIISLDSNKNSGIVQLKNISLDTIENANSSLELLLFLCDGLIELANSKESLDVPNNDPRRIYMLTQALTILINLFTLGLFNNNLRLFLVRSLNIQQFDISNVSLSDESTKMFFAAWAGALMINPPDTINENDLKSLKDINMMRLVRLMAFPSLIAKNKPNSTLIQTQAIQLVLQSFFAFSMPKSQDVEIIKKNSRIQCRALLCAYFILNHYITNNSFNNDFSVYLNFLQHYSEKLIRFLQIEKDNQRVLEHNSIHNEQVEKLISYSMNLFRINVLQLSEKEEINLKKLIFNVSEDIKELGFTYKPIGIINNIENFSSFRDIIFNEKWC